MRTLVIAASVCLAMVGSSFAQTSTVALTRIETRIPPQGLGSALKQFAKLEHIHVLYLTADVKNLRTSGASGNLTPDEALTRLLSGTGLTYRYVDANAISIIRVAAMDSARRSTSAAGDPPPEDPIGKAKTSKSVATHYPSGNVPSGAQQDIRAKTSKPRFAEIGPSLKQVVVTGTYIRGIKTTPSFTSTYSRSEMYSTGANSISQFIQQLPANFSEASDVSVTGTQGGPGFALNNTVAASGIDIHGLGAQSTLVLVNGYRLAPGNYNGGFVDVSTIPLSAIDHVDIVADSASATYGSDAVGGVVNLVTLQRFQGAETRVRYGAVTQGGRRDAQVSETLGTSWPTGGLVFSYQYSDTTPLAASSRAFSSKAASPFYLLPEEVTHELYGSVSESPSDATSLSGFVIYGHRGAAADFVSGGVASIKRTGDVDSGIAQVGLQHQFPWDSIGTASLEYSGNRSTWTDTFGFLPNPSYMPLSSVRGRSGVASLDVGLTGEIGNLGGRRIRFAFGGQLRRERYSYTQALNRFTDSRTIGSEYAELWLPLLPSLDVNLDDRNEHYSEFGATNNPKLALIWAPMHAVTVRASYSTAFRAPSLYDLLNIDQAVFSPVPTSTTSGPCPVAGPGCTNVLTIYGGNPALGPEKAKTWSAGIELRPSSLPASNLGLSFYDIRYHDRINSASSAINILGSLANDSAVLGPTIVRENVSPEEIQQLAQLAGPSETFVYGGADPTTVATVIDNRLQNIATLSTRGIDFRAAYLFRRGVVSVKSELSGTRIIQYTNRFTSSTPYVDALDTAYNPLRIKMRLLENVELRNVSGSVFLNYTGAYINNAIAPAQPVASWTTVDASLTYTRSVSEGKEERRAYLTVGAFNLMNRAPPFLKNPYYPVNFDGTNASPLGRFVYAELGLVL